VYTKGYKVTSVFRPLPVNNGLCHVKCVLLLNITSASSVLIWINERGKEERDRKGRNGAEGYWLLTRVFCCVSSWQFGRCTPVAYDRTTAFLVHHWQEEWMWFSQDHQIEISFELSAFLAYGTIFIYICLCIRHRPIICHAKIWITVPRRKAQPSTKGTEIYGPSLQTKITFLL